MGGENGGETGSPGSGMTVEDPPGEDGRNFGGGREEGTGGEMECHRELGEGRGGPWRGGGPDRTEAGELSQEVGRRREGLGADGGGDGSVAHLGGDRTGEDGWTGRDGTGRSREIGAWRAVGEEGVRGPTLGG